MVRPAQGTVKLDAGHLGWWACAGNPAGPPARRLLHFGVLTRILSLPTVRSDRAGQVRMAVGYVETGGFRLRVKRTGHGPPILLIMGLGGAIETWEPLG